MLLSTVYNLIVECWVYNENIGKNLFNAEKLSYLPYSIDVLNYTDTSILFNFNGVKYYGHYNYIVHSFEFTG